MQSRSKMAAGGFMNRALESMLKECSGKKFPDLHKSIQTYLGEMFYFIFLEFYSCYVLYI